MHDVLPAQAHKVLKKDNLIDDKSINMPNSTEKEHLIHSHQRVYARRWYILLLFASLEFTQCIVWSTFGPIAFATKFAYGWSDATLAMMLNWGCIAFLTFVAPMSSYLERSGLRKTTLLVAALIAAGASCRLVGQNSPSQFTLFAHIGSILNGIAGVTLGSAPPVVSATWFPENERIFATSINMGANLLGAGAAYYSGSKLVPFDNTAVNETMPSEKDAQHLAAVQDLRGVIHHYLSLQAMAGIILLAAVIIYFPARPPSPPPGTAATAATSKETAVESKGWGPVLSDPQLWLVCFANAVPGGMLTTWQSLMGLNFGPLGVTDAEIGRIGFISLFVQAVTASALAFVQDKLPRERMRDTLVGLLCGSLLCFIWLMGLCFGWAQFSLDHLYLATILGVTLSYSSAPIFYEYAVTLGQGCSEVQVGGLMSGGINATTGLFLLVFFIPGLGTSWMNWGLCLTTAAAVPMVLRTKLPPVDTGTLHLA